MASKSDAHSTNTPPRHDGSPMGPAPIRLCVSAVVKLWDTTGYRLDRRNEHTALPAGWQRNQMAVSQMTGQESLITPGELTGSDVHVWSTSLEVHPERVSQLESLLSEDEADRARSLLFGRERLRFIVGRGVLREILGRYLHKPPHLLRFSYRTAREAVPGAPRPRSSFVLQCLAFAGPGGICAVSGC